MAEARKMLNSGELKEFKWTVEDYIKHGQANAKNRLWEKELENASARFHISRLESLKLQTQQSLEVLYGNQLDIVDKTMRNVYSGSYYRTAFEIQRVIGIGSMFDRLDERRLNLVVNKPWAVDGVNFSNRIWKNKEKLVNELHNTLTRNIISGADPAKAIRELKDKLNVSRSAAGRLIMTESAYFSSVAQKDMFNELDVEKYQIVATLDNRTSEICSGIDGKVFDMKDYNAGVTAPPFHPNCRTTTIPYFDDWEEVGVKPERVARDEEGNNYYVPADMTYKEWEKKYVGDSISKQVKKDFQKYSKFTNNKFRTIEEFTKIRYNKDDWELYKTFITAIESGELSALSDFNLYKNISKEMDEKLIGIVTSNGIKITGKSKHSVARVIGSIEQKRSGVEISNIVAALTGNETEILPIKEMKNGRSQKFRTGSVEVSVNPDTGKIIQVNPFSSKRKVNPNSKK